MDIPVFALTSLSVGCFYLSSQMGAYPKSWWKRAIFLPGALALGIGMAINSGRAVFEALLGMDSPIIRTPKYGIEKKGQLWQRAAGRPAKKGLLFMEILLAMYFTGLVFYGILNNYWSSLPFLIMFMMGFWYVVVGSLPQLGQNRQMIKPDRPAAA